MSGRAVTTGWLDTMSSGAMTTRNASCGTGVMVNSTGVLHDYTDTIQWYGYPTWTYVTDAPRPIRLSMAEVDQLRKAAKSDGKLKAILEKFTWQIEIIVEF